MLLPHMDGIKWLLATQVHFMPHGKVLLDRMIYSWFWDINVISCDDIKKNILLLVGEGNFGEKSIDKQAQVWN